jgi:hypothetical protein
MSACVVQERFSEVPRIPASAGALIFDEDGRLLILKPSYKKGWTIPGGQIEAAGESPWAACRREAREECVEGPQALPRPGPERLLSDLDQTTTLLSVPETPLFRARGNGSARASERCQRGHRAVSVCSRSLGQ